MHITPGQIQSARKQARLAPYLMHRHRILPFAMEEDFLCCVTDRSWSSEEIDTLLFQYGIRLKLNLVPASDEFETLLSAFSLGEDGEPNPQTIVINCDDRYQLKCPLLWSGLQETADEHQRFCTVCQQTVHFAQTKEQKQSLARQGYCVACYEPDGLLEDEVTMGLLVDPDSDW